MVAATVQKKRVIVDHKSLPAEVLNELSVKYPYGYNTTDTITFKNAKGETIRALRHETADTVYMVKVSVYLQDMIENTEEEEDLIPKARSSKKFAKSTFDHQEEEDDEGTIGEYDLNMDDDSDQDDEDDY
jgi:hypothetical protein